MVTMEKMGIDLLANQCLDWDWGKTQKTLLFQHHALHLLQHILSQSWYKAAQQHCSPFFLFCS